MEVMTSEVAVVVDTFAEATFGSLALGMFW